MASQLLIVQPRENFKRGEEAESPGADKESAAQLWLGGAITPNLSGV
jgi:hypothetical protein